MNTLNLVPAALAVGYASILGDAYLAARLAVDTWNTVVLIIVNAALAVYRFGKWLQNL